MGATRGKAREQSPARLIDQRIKDLGDWRGKTLAEVRALIRAADPAIVEEWKWGGPVWSRDGVICTGETYKNAVKLTFAKGAALDDPQGLFNSSLGGNTRRAIDIHEGGKINKTAFKALIRAAAKANASKPVPPKATKPKLLSGDNPQIPKGDGDAPVQAYIAAIPGWKRDVARRLDELIEGAVPRLRKGVKWNSPLYGVEGREGWFLSYHCFTNYVKVTFFRGTSLRPEPPGASKHPEVRYLDVREGELDEAQFNRWVKQASKLPDELL